MDGEYIGKIELRGGETSARNKKEIRERKK
jgi:hypothetical protein